MAVNPLTPTAGRFATCVVVAALVACPLPAESAGAQESSPLEAARRSFYSGRYDEAAASTLDACESGAGDAAACELRSSALLLQIKRALKDSRDKRAALEKCTTCPELMAAFHTTTVKGQEVARAQLKVRPDDETALFLLAKLNLNHVWLQLGTLGRRTGWHEYKEARRILDQVLERHPHFVRARVARAWIEYIVATKTPWGTRWILGGGNKKRGLRAVRDAAASEAPFFDQTEALFALWDMQVREKRLPEALETARRLAKDFPDNEELRSFIDANHTALASN